MLIEDNTPKLSGIYTIFALDDFGQEIGLYIGSAINLRRRANEHLRDFRTGCHNNKHMLFFWRKHGPGRMRFEILELVPDRRLLIEREQYWIDECSKALGSRNLFNQTFTAGSLLGYKHSEESKRRMSEKMKGRRLCDAAYEALKRPDVRAKNSALRKGKAPIAAIEAARSPCVREKRSIKNKGNRLPDAAYTPEAIAIRAAKISAAMKGCAPWSAIEAYKVKYKGVAPMHATDAARIANTGRPKTETAKKNISASKLQRHGITFNGETHTLTGWAKKLRTNASTISNRIHRSGWSVERAITEPLKTTHKE